MPTRMDNAQLARQIVRKEGFNTFFIRPYALMQVSAFKAKQGQPELFPPPLLRRQYPRIIPDTYHSPGYSLVLGGLFVLMAILALYNAKILQGPG